jgi:uncharacterized protein involved in copper resistance
MQIVLPFVAAVILGLSWVAPANAEEATPMLTHPADTTQVHQAVAEIDPFALAVPLLNREAPTPSYGGAITTAPVTAPNGEAMPGMDHSNMPGMDHSSMPGMTGN